MAKRETLAIIKAKRRSRGKAKGLKKAAGRAERVAAGRERVERGEKREKEVKPVKPVKPLEVKIAIPSGISSEFDAATGRLALKKGDVTLSREFLYPRVQMSLEKADGQDVAKIATSSRARSDRAIVGTWAAHVRNMIAGMERGYEYKLKIIYSHFPLSVKLVGREVHISNFVGEKSARIAKIFGDQTKVDIQKEFIIVSGPSKDAVGQTCANIERACRLPNRDRRRFTDGIYLIERGAKGAS